MTVSGSVVSVVSHALSLSLFPVLSSSSENNRALSWHSCALLVEYCHVRKCVVQLQETLPIILCNDVTIIFDEIRFGSKVANS